MPWLVPVSFLLFFRTTGPVLGGASMRVPWKDAGRNALP